MYAGSSIFYFLNFKLWQKTEIKIKKEIQTLVTSLRVDHKVVLSLEWDHKEVLSADLKD